MLIEKERGGCVNYESADGGGRVCVCDGDLLPVFAPAHSRALTSVAAFSHTILH